MEFMKEQYGNEKKDIINMIFDKFKIKLSMGATHNLLKNSKMSWLKLRPKNPNSSETDQAQFKKDFQKNAILSLSKDTNLEDVLIWFQDEATFGQQNTTTKIWAPIGSKPRVVEQKQYIHTHVLEAVCPEKNLFSSIIFPDIKTYKDQIYIFHFSLRHYIN